MISCAFRAAHRECTTYFESRYDLGMRQALVMSSIAMNHR